jgi:hypothetical protein
MFVAFIGFLMCSLMKSGFGIAATLSFAEPSCNYSLSLSDIYFWSQTLDIVAENPDRFKVVALAAGSNVTLLADQVSYILTNENA